jgi:hypothetical protein
VFLAPPDTPENITGGYLWIFPDRPVNGKYVGYGSQIYVWGSLTLQSGAMCEVSTDLARNHLGYWPCADIELEPGSGLVPTLTPTPSPSPTPST